MFGARYPHLQAQNAADFALTLFPTSWCPDYAGSAAAVARIAVSRRRCVRAMASAAAVETVVKTQLAVVVHTLNPANFEPFLADNADKLVIVDYYTDCESYVMSVS